METFAKVMIMDAVNKSAYGEMVINNSDCTLKGY